MSFAFLDIVVPVYNEGEIIQSLLHQLTVHVRTRYRVLVCYDLDSDTTLAPVREFAKNHPDVPIELVKNPMRGPHAAIMEGFRVSWAPAVLVWPADDDYNVPLIDTLFDEFKKGAVIVAASRFMKGGQMKGCPWLKALLVRTSAWTLHNLAGVPTKDPSNGLRLFSRHFLQEVPVESTQGFTYSIELLVKAHRLGRPVKEVAVNWFERTRGKSRFRLGSWLWAYLTWFTYAFATTYLGQRYVRLNTVTAPAASLDVLLGHSDPTPAEGPSDHPISDVSIHLEQSP